MPIDEEEESSSESSLAEESDAEIERDSRGRVQIFKDFKINDEAHAYFEKKKATSKSMVLMIALKEALCFEED